MINENDGCRLNRELLIEKIRQLSPDKTSEVYNFVEFLNQKEQDLAHIRTAEKLAESSFTNIWSNPEDDIYNQL